MTNLLDHPRTERHARPARGDSAASVGLSSRPADAAHTSPPGTPDAATRARHRRFQAEYYAHRLAGVHGNVYDVAEQMQGWGDTFNYAAWFMAWDEAARRHARDLERRREIVGHPHYIPPDTYADALRELVRLLEAPA